ncbi:hypothetical protein ACP275_09G110300 [Erythranthe tilingii]
MDQGKSVRAITVITVLVLLCAGQATASFRSCYSDCVADCFAAAGEVTSCLVKCLFKCRKVEITTDDPCKFNCAINQCTRFVHDVDKVDDCMNKCETGSCEDFNQATKTLPRQ